MKERLCLKYLVPLSDCERCRKDIEYRIFLNEKKIERLEDITDLEERRLAASQRCLYCSNGKKVKLAKRRVRHYNT